MSERINEMKDLNNIIIGLEQSPAILKHMITDIPTVMLKVQRRKGKWTIHENACHLAQAEKMINNRFRTFVNEESPTFDPYIPGDTVVDDLMQLDLEEEIENFITLRKDTVGLLKMFDQSIWKRKAVHPQYTDYDARILARHTLMHDHFHMYRIEELWLTKDEPLLL